MGTNEAVACLKVMKEKSLVKLAYSHDGTSTYDTFFLEQFAKENTVYFLTFNRKPHMVPEKARIIKIREPFDTFTEKREWIEGLRMYLLFFLRALLLKHYLGHMKPDIVIGCMATKYGFYTALSGFKPFILIVWGSDIIIAPKRFSLFRFMAEYSLRKADVVVLDSDVQKEAAIQLGCNPEKIIQFAWFDSKEVHVTRSRTEVRRQLGWNDNLIVVCTRSHERIYGVDYFVESFPQIVEKAPEIRFILIGEGSLTQHLKVKVRDLKMEKYVKFFGRVPHDDVATYLNASDIYVSTSFSDGTSASLLEAMVCKLPSIVTDIAGNREWIQNGTNGFLIHTADSKHLAEKIVLLAKEKDLRQRVGETAQSTVQERVDWRKASQTLQNSILKLVNK